MTESKDGRSSREIEQGDKFGEAIVLFATFALFIGLLVDFVSGMLSGIIISSVWVFFSDHLEIENSPLEKRH